MKISSKEIIYHNGNEFFRVLENKGQRLIAFDILNEETHNFELKGNGYSCNYFSLGQGKEIELQKNDLGELMAKVECEHCYGDGVVHPIIQCGKTASNCCGGCTEEVVCPECKGDGGMLVDLEEAFE